ncbi:MAG: hypothetical protein WKF86_07595, partial [Acidimicrobiales bacterium]
RWRWMRESGVITIDNPSQEARAVLLSVEVRTARPGSGETTLSLPDGTAESIRDFSPAGSTVRRRMEVPPGRTTLRVESTAQPITDLPNDPRRLVAQLLDMVLVPVELCEAAGALGAPAHEGGCLATSHVQRP